MSIKNRQLYLVGHKIKVKSSKLTVNRLNGTVENSHKCTSGADNVSGGRESDPPILDLNRKKKYINKFSS